MSFQAHGAPADGSVAFRKKLTRERVLGFLAEQPRCVVAMEACGSAHHWGRAIRNAGHEVRLIPPAYVQPFVKRQKNDAADGGDLCKSRAAGGPRVGFDSSQACATPNHVRSSCATSYSGRLPV
jgi:transposase